MKRYLLVVVVFMAGCGGNPAAPSSSAPVVARPVLSEAAPGPFDCSSVRWFAPGCGCVENKIVCVDQGPLSGPEVK